MRGIKPSTKPSFLSLSSPGLGNEPAPTFHFNTRRQSDSSSAEPVCLGWTLGHSGQESCPLSRPSLQLAKSGSHLDRTSIKSISQLFLVSGFSTRLVVKVPVGVPLLTASVNKIILGNKNINFSHPKSSDLKLYLIHLICILSFQEIVTNSSNRCPLKRSSECCLAARRISGKKVGRRGNFAATRAAAAAVTGSQVFVRRVSMM